MLGDEEAVFISGLYTGLGRGAVGALVVDPLCYDDRACSFAPFVRGHPLVLRQLLGHVGFSLVGMAFTDGNGRRVSVAEWHPPTSYLSPFTSHLSSPYGFPYDGCHSGPLCRCHSGPHRCAPCRASLCHGSAIPVAFQPGFGANRIVRGIACLCCLWLGFRTFYLFCRCHCFVSIRHSAGCPAFHPLRCGCSVLCVPKVRFLTSYFSVIVSKNSSHCVR